ncbi:MAG: Fic family protein [Zoogloeaceae bacterium]|nr:Fic family protein [Zoogloeaceae bacterium]
MRDQDEFWLVQQRIGELLERPISGNFDVAHLKETHRYIFQDLPKVGLWNYDVQPGEFRKETPTWCKERVLASIEGEDGKKPDLSFTSYSRMGKKSIERLQAALKEANPERLKVLNRGAFVERISTLYSDLDSLHPFREGNSRTLRTFTDQLGRESGYELNWEKFSGERNRDLLYIARDRGLAERAPKRAIFRVRERDRQILPC